MKPVATFAATALALLFCAQAAAANEYSALLKARKYAETERLANTRLVQEPANAAALIAKSDAILAGGPASRIEEAVKLGEQCVAAHPQTSDCHLALGNALGTKAMHGGLMSAMGYAGTIRDAFKRAIELDQRNLAARFSLLQYYLQAPAIVGGGTGKAETLAAQTTGVSADASKLMLARLDLAEGNIAKVEAAVLAVRPGDDKALADFQRDLLVSIGNKYLGEKKYGDSERLFREAVKRFPDSEWGLYGIARIDQEQGRHRDAIGGFDQVLAISAKPHVYYRIAQSWQALGDKARAVALFEKALSFDSGLSEKMKDDAAAQLKALRR